MRNKIKYQEIGFVAICWNSINYGSLIDKLREEIIEIMEKEKICGLAIALVDNDKIVWSEGFEKAYEFILKTIEIDEAFKDNLRNLV